MELLVNSIGMTGVLLILLAYFLLQRGTLTLKNLAYHWLNLIGALLIIVSLMVFWNLSSFVIEIAWAAISAYGVWKCITSGRRSNS